jgi:hypothetical protein
MLAMTYAQGVASANPPACFGEITTGKNSLYHTQNGVPRTDLSGTATDGTHIIFGDDGGDAGPGFGFNFVRVTTDIPDDDGVNVPLTQNHTDVEAATYLNGYFYIATSLSSAAAAQQLITRFQLNADGTQLLGEESVNIVGGLKEALRVNFGDEWYDSWKNLAAKSGGLNIEGMSRTNTAEEAIVLGLRSPLFGGDFPADLHSGNAILATVKNPFGAAPTYDFLTVDLGGLGVRGMEWIPALHSYVISAGPVEKATEYSLYQVFPDGSVRHLDLPGMGQLCRPESLIQQTKDGKDYLVVLSEDSGPECTGVPFTYIKAEIVPGAGRCH